MRAREVRAIIKTTIWTVIPASADIAALGAVSAVCESEMTKMGHRPETEKDRMVRVAARMMGDRHMVDQAKTDMHRTRS